MNWMMLPQDPLAVVSKWFNFTEDWIFDNPPPSHIHLFYLVETLFEADAVTKSKYDVHKIVTGRKEFTAKDITVQAHAFTKSARAAIEAAGGKCEVLKPSTGAVIEA